MKFKRISKDQHRDFNFCIECEWMMFSEHRERTQWVVDNIVGEWGYDVIERSNGERFWFELESDAIMFIMRWS